MKIEKAEAEIFEESGQSKVHVTAVVVGGDVEFESSVIGA